MCLYGFPSRTDCVFFHWSASWSQDSNTAPDNPFLPVFFAATLDLTPTHKLMQCLLMQQNFCSKSRMWMGMDNSVELRAVSDVRMACGTCATRLSLEQNWGGRRSKLVMWVGSRHRRALKRGGGGRGDLGCDFPRGLESLNGKSNGAIRCNHKSQKGGKGLRTEMHTEFKVTLT